MCYLIFTNDEVRALFEASGRLSGDDPCCQRAQAALVLRLLYSTGMRCGEACSLGNLVAAGGQAAHDRLRLRVLPRRALGGRDLPRRARQGAEGPFLRKLRRRSFLRHTFLTVAARNGVHPSVMQHLAGHATSRITMDIYTHVNMEQKRAAMDAMQGAFSVAPKEHAA